MNTITMPALKQRQDGLIAPPFALREAAPQPRPRGVNQGIVTGKHDPANMDATAKVPAFGLPLDRQGQAF
jgi:hypothetical protein